MSFQGPHPALGCPSCDECSDRFRCQCQHDTRWVPFLCRNCAGLLCHRILFQRNDRFQGHNGGICRGLTWTQLMLQGVESSLLGQQVCLHDGYLFLNGVPRELEDLQPVEERTADERDVVCSADEDDTREVEGGAQVVVLEGRVLFRVQDLQECCLRVEGGALSELVDLIEKDHRVFDAQLHKRMDKDAGRAANVGAAVPPELGLVPHAAQGNVVELPADCACDRAHKGRLPDAGWPVKTEDRPRRNASPQLLHSQELKDPPLHPLQAAMVSIEACTCCCEVDPVFGAGVPRETRQCLHVLKGNRILWVLGLHCLQVPQLSPRYPERVSRESRLGDPPAELLNFLQLLRSALAVAGALHPGLRA
mmetsp:Transcript_113025/g.314557  ORF Transcript_113025/g.314557 Transcript_113025/m.314557 type:complete len:364 (+) Transcript_113025:915-2006(+)